MVYTFIPGGTTTDTNTWSIPVTIGSIYPNGTFSPDTYPNTYYTTTANGPIIEYIKTPHVTANIAGGFFNEPLTWNKLAAVQINQEGDYNYNGFKVSVRKIVPEPVLETLPIGEYPVDDREI